MTQSRNVRFRGQRIIVGLTASALAALFGQGGCAVSDPTSFVLVPDGGLRGTGGFGAGGSSDPGTGGSFGSGGDPASGGSNGTGGTFSTGGSNGAGGAFGTGGSNGTGGFQSTGGFTGSGGVTGTGGFTGSGGVTATGGFTGAGGTRATGGATGAGGSRATGGTTGSGGSTGAGGSAPTFTQIYQSILTVSCGGNSCHNPGTQGNVSFASQSSAYSAVKSRVSAGNATGSSFYQLVNGGKMPPGGPKLSSSALSMIAAWINAGALNN